MRLIDAYPVIVTERLAEANGLLPSGVSPPQLSPLSSSMEYLVHFGFTSEKLSPLELRDLIEWVVKPQILAVPGIAQAQIFGGEVRERRIEVDPLKLAAYGLTLQDVADAMGMQPFMLAEESLVEETVKAETAADTGVDPMTSAHMRNWMECVRNRKTPNADIQAGYNHSVALCMTIAALHTGKRATFDDAKQKVVVVLAKQIYAMPSRL